MENTLSFSTSPPTKGGVTLYSVLNNRKVAVQFNLFINLLKIKNV